MLGSTECGYCGKSEIGNQFIQTTSICRIEWHLFQYSIKKYLVKRSFDSKEILHWNTYGSNLETDRASLFQSLANWGGIQ